jgi:hypothetical protein
MNFDAEFWRQILTTNLSDEFWRQILATNFGDFCFTWLFWILATFVFVLYNFFLVFLGGTNELTDWLTNPVGIQWNVERFTMNVSQWTFHNKVVLLVRAPGGHKGPPRGLRNTKRRWDEKKRHKKGICWEGPKGVHKGPSGPRKGPRGSLVAQRKKKEITHPTCLFVHRFHVFSQISGLSLTYQDPILSVSHHFDVHWFLGVLSKTNDQQ